jgi:hypothetical protein
MPLSTKLLGLAALVLIVCSVASVSLGPWYELRRDPNLACCSEIVIGERWIRLGQILFLVAIALVVAGVRLWLQNRSVTKRNALL